jgi:hypothetical protein
MLGTLLVVVPPFVVVILPPVIFPLLALPLADVLLVLPCALAPIICIADKPATAATIDTIAIRFNLFIIIVYKLELYNNGSAPEGLYQDIFIFNA